MAPRENKSQVRPNVGLAYHYMEYYARLAVALNSVPYTYNKATLHYEVNRKSLKFILWFFTMPVLIGIEAGQMTFEVVRQSTDDTVTQGEWCLVCFLFLSWAFMALVHLNVLFHPHEIVNHLNQKLRMRQWFTEDRLPLTSDHKIIRIQMIFCAIQWVAQSLTVTLERNKSHFVYSYIPKANENPATVALWATYSFYRVMTNFLAVLMQYFTSILHVTTCTQVLELRRKGKLPDDERLKYYRMLQLLSGRFCESYSKAFIPNVTAFCITNIVLGVYATVKLHDQLEFDKFMNFPPMVIVMLVGIITFFPKNASVYEISKDEYKQTLRQVLAAGTFKKIFFRLTRNARIHGDRQDSGGLVHATQAATAIYSNMGTWKEARMVAKSCQPIGVPFGSFYYIQQSTALTLLDFTLSNTVSTMISF